jgi:hypothetical protein
MGDPMRVRHVTNILDMSLADDGPGVERPQRGDIEISPEDILLCCPGCGTVCCLPYSPTKGLGAKWSFDGNHEAPTLTPSINHIGCWHGWLRDGVLTPC